MHLPSVVRLPLLAVVATVAVYSKAAAAEEENCALGVRTTEPLPPAGSRKFRLPPGFEIQLVAAEPDIHKPMNLAFDTAGRLWVTTSIEYPGRRPQPARTTA